MVLLHLMHVFVIPGNCQIIRQHGTPVLIVTNRRVPEACAYTYQSYPTSIKEGMQTTFPHGLSELNGGLQIFKPCKTKFDRIYAVLNTSASNEFLFADQSLLSKTFRGEWTPLYRSFGFKLM
jgi:hypothetical protein